MNCIMRRYICFSSKNAHVPYRNNKLTQLLQDSLGGQAKTLMFVHISPELDAIGETLSTLKFAERVSTVELGAAKMNKDSGDVRELKDQIASLKATLARKDEESKTRIRAPSPSTLYSNCCVDRQPMEEVGNIEMRNNPSTRQRKPSYDLQKLLLATDSHPWLDTSPLSKYINKGHEKDINYRDWVDKVVVKDGSTLKDLKGECEPSPEFFYQTYVSDTTLYSEQKYKKNGAMGEERHEIEIQRNRFDSMATDDSDVATSDSSEADLLWQYNISKIVNAVNGSGLKNKKPQTNKAANSPDFRTPTRPLIPSPSRKSTSTSNRLARQPSSSCLNGKRPTSGGRMGSGK